MKQQARLHHTSNINWKSYAYLEPKKKETKKRLAHRTNSRPQPCTALLKLIWKL
uniref:Uncharacterized protein n=1 Tax=Arundo donax TaxID=35708 RepID=A0A0A9F0Y6_ARUDO